MNADLSGGFDSSLFNILGSLNKSPLVIGAVPPSVSKYKFNPDKLPFSPRKTCKWSCWTNITYTCWSCWILYTPV